MARPDHAPCTRPRLLVGGLHAGGSGYPNATHTLALLRQRWDVDTIECGAWLPPSLHLWRLGAQPGLRRYLTLARLAFGNLISLWHVLRRQTRPPVPVYVPYPAVFFLWWASWLPERLRPSIIADAYISLWDAFARDRTQHTRHGITERIIKRFERRALRTARWVLVDTEAHRRRYMDAFDLPSTHVRSLPLAIDEAVLLDSTSRTPKRDGTITVIFVGTMIPLHGIEVILEAIEALASDTRLRFRLIGDGQLGQRVSDYIASAANKRVEWVRAWQSPMQLAQAIADADICLGVFGGPHKAARVLPLKLYMYLAAGKPIITQALMSLPAPIEPPPVVRIAMSETGALATALRTLADNADLRASLGGQARRYFQAHLGSEEILRRWREFLP